MVQKLRGALVAAGEMPTHCAWFRVADSEAFEHDLHEVEELGRGFISVGADQAPKALPQESPHRDRMDLGNHVALSVTEDRVSIWSEKSPRVLGRLLATYRRGTFRAHCHHYPERVDLTTEDDVNGRMYLIGTWTLFNDECLHTARAVEEMATGPAH
ncbi:MAG: hypothetical protein HKL85_04545 [Acidimicrobiaceae bacterium]|nr:hypothetical protein [Acidimicrobiaceae bacterium]